MVVLILAVVVLGHWSREGVVEDLADRDAGVDPNGVRGVHLQRPVPAEAGVAESGGHMHKQPQSSD